MSYKSTDVKTPGIVAIAKKWKLPVAKVMKLINQGAEVEKEHNKSIVKARQVARDHISERPDYYSKLKKMEKTPISMKEETVTSGVRGLGYTSGDPAGTNYVQQYVDTNALSYDDLNGNNLEYNKKNHKKYHRLSFNDFDPKNIKTAKNFVNEGISAGPERSSDYSIGDPGGGRTLYRPLDVKEGKVLDKIKKSAKVGALVGALGAHGGKIYDIGNVATHHDDPGLAAATMVANIHPASRVANAMTTALKASKANAGENEFSRQKKYGTKVITKEEQIKEDLRKWFREKWVRYDTKGNIKGPCAREEGEGKPKCRPLASARAMSKDERAKSARRKRREDPVADRSGKGGKPINVQTEETQIDELHQDTIWDYSDKALTSLDKAHKVGYKKNFSPNPGKKAAEARKTFDKRDRGLAMASKRLGGVFDEETLLEKNVPTNPALWARAKAQAKAKFDVYPSAYANGWASKWYKSKGGGWKSADNKSVDEACWDTHKQVGWKKKGKRMVPDCVLKEDGFDLDAVTNAIRSKESRNDYGAKSKSSSASGAYQYINKTWKGSASKYGVDTKQFPTAKSAPKEVQDKVFTNDLTKNASKYGSLEKAVNVHYTGNPGGKVSAAGLKANRGQTGGGYMADIKKRVDDYNTERKSTMGAAQQMAANFSGNKTLTTPDSTQFAKAPEAPKSTPTQVTSAPETPKPTPTPAAAPTQVASTTPETPKMQNPDQNITKMASTSQPSQTQISQLDTKDKQKVAEDWQKVNRKDKTDGLSQKAVDAYKRENPGSKLQTAVTEKNPTGKRASRRKSFCSRMGGMKKRLTSAKTARDPNSRINKALRRWNCEESVINELTPLTPANLGVYVSGAAKSRKKSLEGPKADIKTWGKRQKGMERAWKKLTKENSRDKDYDMASTFNEQYHIYLNNTGMTNTIHEETTMENQNLVNEAIENILDNNLNEMKENLMSALQEKANEKLEERKKIIAANYFAQ